jgi:hypothetical protein
MNVAAHRSRAAAALARHTDATTGGRALEVIDHRPDHIRGGRSVLRARAADTPQTLILKVYDLPNAATVQFDALSQLSKSTGHVVKPIFLAPKENLFAMQDAGQPLTKGMSTETTPQVTTQALRWLDLFCSDTPQQTKTFDMRPHLALAKRETEYMPQRFHKSAPQVLTRLRSLIAPFQGKPLAHCTSFNDFKPENLCICEQSGRITGIDFLPGDPQPMERDAAFFLHWIEQYKWRQSLRTRHEPIRRTDFRDINAALDTLPGQLDPALLTAFGYAFAISTWHKLAYFGRSPDLIRIVEVRLGLRHPATLLRPFLRKTMPLLR